MKLLPDTVFALKARLAFKATMFFTRPICFKVV